jgi:hypothetical protein
MGGVMPREGGDGTCSLAEVFFPLAAARQLPRFTAAFEDYAIEDGEGNCHDVALALMVDLICLDLGHGWTWVRGITTFAAGRGEHSWCEYDGWAIDAASG